MALLQNIKKLHADSLFRNSFYLMMATAVMAGFGFFFWLINAHLYSTENIGLATTLISVMGLIGTLSLIGFNATFVRFLPRSEDPNDEMNTGLLLVGATAAVLGTIFIIFVNQISPSLSFIARNPLTALAFIFFCSMTGINILTDSVFLAQRQAKYTFIINTIFSAVKMLLPFAFVGWGALGVFGAAALGQTVGMVLSVYVMIVKFNYRPQLIIKIETLKRVWAYAARNYISGIFNLLPVTVLPILITNSLGAKSAAYFYIAMMIGNLLYVIPYAATKALFAESSHDEQSVSANIKKAVKMNTALLLPAILVLVIFGRYILTIFGKSYSTEGATFLTLVAITGIAVFAYSLCNSLFQLEKNSNMVIFINIVYAIAIIGLSYLWLPLGLTGIGLAWLTGTALAGLLGFVMYRGLKNYSKDKFLDLLFDVETIVVAKVCFVIARIKNGLKKKTILFYPELPHSYHVIYSICHLLGYTITNDPNSKPDIVMAFADATVRKDDTTMAALTAQYNVYNRNCGDISKERVEKIFSQIFGYGMAVDPRTYSGQCVKKSNDNGKHDGAVITCPTTPEPGYIYQKLINNQEGEKVYDLRAIVNGYDIPFIVRRFKSVHDRFDHTKNERILTTEEAISKEEKQKIIDFCKAFGMDYGELDILRDRDDGKIYIVDANNTPAPPKPGQHIGRWEFYTFFLKRITDSFAKAFMTH